MQLSIVIVNFNVKHFLEQALVSILKATQGIETEIFVVDNASQDGSVAMVHEKFPTVKLIANTRNRGFGAANNQALKLATGEFVACINPDTIIQEDTFQVLFKYFSEHPKAGMLGCKVLNPDGTLQLACRRSFPTPWVAFTKISGLSRYFPKSKLFGRYNLTYLDPDASYEVEAISGSFMLLRKTALDQVGYFDETWFMYGEDLDLCYRFREAGWKICYIADTKIIHFKGESSKQSDFDTIRLFYQAMSVFVGKYHKSPLLQFILVLAVWLRAGMHFVKHFISLLIVPLIDVLFLNLALILALFLRFGHLQHIHSYILVTILYSSVWIAAMFFSSNYSKHKFSASSAILATISGLIINTSLTFFFNQIAYSRAVVLIAGGFSLLFLVGWRLVVKLTSRWGMFKFQEKLGHTIWRRRTLILGNEKGVDTLIDKLEQQIDGSYEISGIVSYSPDDLGKQVKGYPVLGTVENLDAIIKHQHVRDVIFSTDEIEYDKIMEVMYRGRGLGINYRLVPDNFEVIIGKSSIDPLGELHLIEIDNRIDRPVSIVLKRGFDIILASLALIPGLPILLYYLIFRFKHLRRIAIQGENGKPAHVILYKNSQHPVLRYLPGLISILGGSISFVGTEIIPLEKRLSESKKIFALKPGLTGLVQISQKKNLSEVEKQRHYLYYIKNYTLMLDLEILIKALLKI